MSEPKQFTPHIQRNLIAGVLTIIPILVVWIVLDFVFAFLFSVGSPVGRALIRVIAAEMPEAAPILTSDIFEWLVAVVLALLLIYGIGAAASRVIGLKLIGMFEALVAKIPFVQGIYSGSKKLVGALRQKPGNVSRAVLVDFPSAPTKAVGFVMRTYTDAGTGQETAMVYVPTAFNPTAGFLEFVPVANLTSLDMSMDQAMAMVVSGGAVSPDRISSQPPPTP